jgi:nitrogenase molybdenum-iron protein NifN
MGDAPYVSTTNACKLCTPLGACLAFRGIEGAIPLLHGSQGCATYMRRYVISHFREPVDIASSSLGEKQAIYGGGPNLKSGLKNVIAKYRPRLIGIASTCLTETIGDDARMIVREFLQEAARDGSAAGLPALVTVSTPSYSGTHMEGFHAAVKAVAEQICESGDATGAVNLLPGFLSPADLRYLKEILDDFGMGSVLLPDISETLDGPALPDYPKIPRGGTPLESIRKMGASRATIEFGRTLQGSKTAGKSLSSRFGAPLFQLGAPIGIQETDAFFDVLRQLGNGRVPAKYEMERGRLVDAYVDAHKYLFGKRAVVYGEEDLVTGLAAFLAEVGVNPVLCASGGKSGNLRAAIESVTDGIPGITPDVREGADFHEIAAEAESLAPDILIGNSKGYPIAKKLGIPLVRVGFPIHDRFGGQRILHAGYRGATALLDRIVNALIGHSQDSSPVGYAYM